MSLIGNRILIVELDLALAAGWADALRSAGADIEQQTRAGKGLETVLLGAVDPRPHTLIVLGPSVASPMRDAFRHTLVGVLRKTKLVLVEDGAASAPSTSARGVRVGLGTPEGILRAVMMALGHGDPHTSPTRPAKPRILLAEDNPINQEVAELALESAGFDVHPVFDGHQAVTSVQQHDFAAIVMDIQMPTMDGLTATRLIRAMPEPKHATPIVAMTANVLPNHREAAAAAGMDGFVEKPIKPEILISTIYTAIRHESDFRTQPQKPRRQSEIIDLEVLNQLKDTFGPALSRVQNTLTDDAPKRVKRMLAAARDADFDTIRREAHSLKSSTGTFGLTRLADLSRDIESACTQGRHPDAISALEHLDAALHPDLDFLDRHMG